MIGIDTNVFVRYLVQDDVLQSALATEVIENFSQAEPGFISQITLVEIVWVLTRCYKQSREKIVKVVETLLKSNVFLVENAEAIYQTLIPYKNTKAEFSDALIACAGAQAKCETTLTFDLKASELKGMTLLASVKTTKH